MNTYISGFTHSTIVKIKVVNCGVYHLSSSYILDEKRFLSDSKRQVFCFLFLFHLVRVLVYCEL